MVKVKEKYKMEFTVTFDIECENTLPFFQIFYEKFYDSLHQISVENSNKITDLSTSLTVLETDKKA